MKKKNIFKIIFLTICVVIMIPLSAILIYAVIFIHNLEMKDGNYYFESELISKDFYKKELSYEGITYYEDMQSSIEKFYMENEKEKYTPEESDKIIVFGNEMMLYICMSKSLHLSNTLQCFVLEKKEGLYSYPLYDWEQFIYWYKGKTKKNCCDSDRVALAIASSYIYREMTAQVNSGIPIFYGVGKEAETRNLSIMGVRPDEVFPFTYEDETYYFWYYLDGSFLVERMEECIDLEQRTVEEAVEYFEIQF